MSATEVEDTGRDAALGTVDMKLEVQVIAVSEVSDIWHGPPLPRRAREAQRVLAPVAPVGPDKDWPAWYAACMAAEQAGTDLLT